MLKTLKKDSPIIYILITALGILLWFKGMYGSLDYIIPSGLCWSLLTAGIGLLLLYLNDFNLSELHNIKMSTPSAGYLALHSQHKNPNTNVHMQDNPDSFANVYE